MLGFRYKVLVILIKCSLKISDSLLSSENRKTFSEIIILLEKFPLSETYGLIVCQKFLFSVQVLGLPLNFVKSSFVICRVTSFRQIWFYLNGFLPLILLWWLFSMFLSEKELLPLKFFFKAVPGY